MNSSNDKIYLERMPELEAKLEKYGLLPKEPVITKKELRELIGKVDEKIAQKKRKALDLPNPATSELLTHLTEIALLGMASLAGYMSKNGIGLLPHKEENEMERAKQFSFELFLQMLIGSDFLSTIFKHVSRNCDTTEKNREKIAESLKLIILLFTLYGAANGDEERLKQLVEGVSGSIQKGIRAVEGIVKEETLSLRLRQADLALEKGEIDQFVAACKGALETLKITPEEMQKDLKRIKNLSNIVAEAIANSGEEPTTTIAHAM